MENKLCINPKCSFNCEVVKIDGVWKYVSGFQMPLTEIELQNFDPESDTNLCVRCEGVIKILQNKKLLPST